MKQRQASGGARSGAVLCLGDDPDLRALLASACAEAGVRTDSVTGRPTLMAWTGAAAVLVPAGEPDLVRDLPRRDDVVLVHHDPRGVDDEPGPDIWRAAVAVGAGQVVVLPLAREWLVDAVRRACRPTGWCVAVVGARGGAGATSAAVALASAGATAGYRVLLVDADPLGGGIDLALGAEDLPGPRWSDLHDVVAPLPAGGLVAALPVADGVAVLSHGRAAVAVDQAAARAVVRSGVDEHDLVVVDLPRAGDEAAQSMAVAADVLLCVCPTEVRAVAAAPAVLAGWPGVPSTHLLLRGPAPGGLRPADAAAAVEAGRGPAAALDRVDVCRAEPGLAAALERGEPFAVGARSPLRRWAAGWVEHHLPGGGRAVA
ncbi:septum site-determining protein Ssd [Aquipuribacter sp. MA13-6]|uniref:septum site-determining protein Ssd n=1 Tax=unclassified Aquipuribacter TaxID=2635084 RepID=UPI003EECE387